MVAVDCEKAFDSITFDVIMHPVKGSPLKGIIKELFCFQRLRIHDTNLRLYPDRGTPLGGALSPFLINATVDALHRKMELTPKGTMVT